MPFQLLFNGNNSNGHAAVAQWQSVVPRQWLLARVRLPATVTSREPSHAVDAYLWSDPEARQSTLDATISVFESQARGLSLAVCGLSLGCTTALEAVRMVSRPIHLLCLAAPSIHPDRLASFRSLPSAQNLIVFAGENDHRASRFGWSIISLEELALDRVLEVTYFRLRRARACAQRRIEKEASS